MSILLDLALLSCLLTLAYWVWLSFKYLYATGRYLGRWIGYRFIPTIKVKCNGVFVGRITQKEYDDMIVKIEEWTKEDENSNGD